MLLATALAAAVPLALTACSRDEGVRVALFTKNQTNPYFQSVRLGAERAAADGQVDLVHYIPTRPDSIPEQMSEIDDAITKSIPEPWSPGSGA
jgi:ribose transport system substrate-binding protein